MSKSTPADPYKSYMVEASAGTGKTFQLSKRFLNLVGMGSDPSKILTITFTVKAACEMRARIISEATQLLVDSNKQKEFQSELEAYYRASPQKNSLKRPIPAKKAAEIILSATQRLRISTIDSVFNEWMMKFPYETGALSKVSGSINRLKLIDTLEGQELNKRAFSTLFKPPYSDRLADLFQSTGISQQGVLNLKERIFELHRYCSYIGLKTIAGEASWAPFPLGSETFKDDHEVIEAIRQDLYIVIQQLNRAEEYQPLLASTDLPQLLKSKLFTQQLLVSKALLRGKKREAVQDSIDRIESSIQEYFGRKKLERLNLHGETYIKLYRFWSEIREQMKSQSAWFEFADLAMAGYRLFHEDPGIGATWLLHKNLEHLLIDEFQDTSLLQWSIFRPMAEELLAGSGDHAFPRSVFLVGDPKQSIYGFREADPKVMGLAQETFLQFEQPLAQLSTSYRSSKTVLEWVNRVFSTSWGKSFPIHLPAESESGEPQVADVSELIVTRVFAGDPKEGLKPAEEEAMAVAKRLKYCLERAESYPVFDRKTRSFRPLRAKDCALLYRNTARVHLFEKALRKLSIPYRKEEQKGFFSRFEITDTIALLQFLAFPEDLHSLLIVLTSPLFCLSDAKLLRMVSILRQQEETLDPQTQVQEFLLLLQAHEPDLWEKLQSIQGHAVELSPFELLSVLLFELKLYSGYVDYYEQVEAELAVANIHKLLENVFSWEREGILGLPLLVERLKQLSQDDQVGNAHTEADAVQLMTLHKAKGLEFPMVYIVESFENWFKQDKYWLKTEQGLCFIGQKDDQPIGSSLFNTYRDMSLHQSRLEAERLLYVGLTRASQYLWVSGHKVRTGSDHGFLGGVQRALCGFSDVEACEYGFKVDRRHRVEFKQQKSAPRLVLPRLHQDREPQLSLLAPHAMNPKQEAVSEWHPTLAKKRGTYIHNCLEQSIQLGFFQNTVSHEEMNEVLFKLSHSLFSEREKQIFSAEVCTRGIVTAQDEVWANLQNKDLQKMIGSAEQVYSEMGFAQLRGRFLIKGFVDLILSYSKYVLVIDFKAEEASQSLLESQLPEHCEEHYGNQLQAYRLAVKELFPDKEVRTGVWLTKRQTLVLIDTVSTKEFRQAKPAT